MPAAQTRPIDFEALKQQLAGTLSGRIRRATVPLYFGVAKDKMQLDRSAVVLRIGDHFFLLTAMHYLERYSRPGVFAFTQQGIMGDGSVCGSVDLTGRQIVGFGGKADVGAVVINAADAHIMGKTFDAITPTDLDFRTDIDVGEPFVICGYPISIEDYVPFAGGLLSAPKPFTLLTDVYSGPLEGEEKINYAGQIAVGFPKSFCPSLTAEVPEEKVPRPQGISGGGIWRIGFSPTEPDKFVFKLAAIQSSVHRGLDYAVGGRVGLAIYAIWHQIPEMRGAIEQAMPKTFPIFPPEHNFKSIDRGEGA